MDDSDPMMEIIRQTNATYLSQLLQDLPGDVLSSLYQRFRVTSVAELVSILHGNASHGNVTYEGGGGGGEGGGGGQDQETVTAVATTLMLVVPAIIIAVGTVGNLLTFLIFITDRTMRAMSTYFYLAVLALADTFVLYMGLMTRWVSLLIGHDVRVESTIFCKVNNALGHTVSDFSVWLLVAVTCERFVVVCFPLRASAICRRRSAHIVVFLLLCVFASINFHLFWTTDVRTHGLYLGTGKPRLRCGGGDGYEFLVDLAWPWVDAVLYSLLPFLIIAIINVVIIVQVMNAKQRRQDLSNHSATTTPTGNSRRGGSERGNGDVANSNSGRVSTTSILKQRPSPTATSSEVYPKSPSTSSASHPMTSQPSKTVVTSSQDSDSMRLTVMLLVVTFTFLITTLPITLVNMAGMLLHSLTDDRHIALYHLTRRICELLMYVNHSVNFFLYCATGQKFRRQLCVLLMCVWKRRGGQSASRRGTARASTVVTSYTETGTPPSDPHRHTISRRSDLAIQTTFTLSKAAEADDDDQQVPMISSSTRDTSMTSF